MSSAKARLALVALSKRDYDLAHNLIKEGLSSQPKNPELRALYTYFLLETKAAPSSTYDFTVGTLRDQNRHDLYSLCAAGSIQYTKAREMRDPAGAAERTRVYVRAAEYFEKALLLDPSCAFAAQGLAIGIAEGTIGTGIPVVPGVPVEEHAVRSKNSRDALTILTKLKDAINSGSVYVNIGHCHFVREEWEKAIESVSCRLFLSSVERD
jgi:RNA polymerase-associated protein CTR9